MNLLVKFFVISRDHRDAQENCSTTLQLQRPGCMIIELVLCKTIVKPKEEACYTFLQFIECSHRNVLSMTNGVKCSYRVRA